MARNEDKNRSAGVCAAEGAAPPVLLLGLENSNARPARERAPLTRVTLFAPFWLDNRTGRPLVFQDRAAAPASACLLGGRAPGTFAEVLCPGARGAVQTPCMVIVQQQDRAPAGRPRARHLCRGFYPGAQGLQTLCRSLMKPVMSAMSC